MPTHTESLSHSPENSLKYKTWEIFYAGVYRKMFLENILSPLVYILSREREKILLVCLQVREDQKEQTNVFITSAELPAKRLSTAFDSVTLYGNDPHTRPDMEKNRELGFLSVV
jgi:methylmalonyl-CoA mutase